MEEITLEDVKQLLAFYRQKSAELELQYLELQIKFNKLIASIPSENIKSKK